MMKNSREKDRQSFSSLHEYGKMVMRNPQRSVGKGTVKHGTGNRFFYFIFAQYQEDLSQYGDVLQARFDQTAHLLGNNGGVSGSG